MKKFCILVCILLCCGCKARYEIKFNGNDISDKLSITYSKNDEITRSFVPDPLYAFDSNQYELKSNDNGKYINLNYTYDFDISNYSKAFIPSSCFSSFNFIEEDDKFYFMADGEFLCRHIANKYFDSLDIVIATNHVVIQSNADEVKNGKYIWHVDSNKETLSLKFVTSSKIKSDNTSIYFWGIFSIFGIIVTLLIKKFIKKRKITSL